MKYPDRFNEKFNSPELLASLDFLIVARAELGAVVLSERAVEQFPRQPRLGSFTEVADFTLASAGIRVYDKVSREGLEEPEWRYTLVESTANPNVGISVFRPFDRRPGGEVVVHPKSFVGYKRRTAGLARQLLAFSANSVSVS